MMGTPDYMAPEQALDTKHVDARADVYSLGCTLFRMLTGELPYAGETFVQMLMAHCEAPIPDLRAKRSDIPETLQAIFDRMVAKQASDRHQTMVEVVADLEAFQRGEPIPSANRAATGARSAAAGGKDVKILVGPVISNAVTSGSGRPSGLEETIGYPSGKEDTSGKRTQPVTANAPEQPAAPATARSRTLVCALVAVGFIAAAGVGVAIYLVVSG
jgi:serine/threonine protein kinase